MERMEQWTIDLRNSVTQGEMIAEDFGADAEEIDAVCKVYPMRIPRYYYNLIQEKGDPIWMQSVPSINELMDESSPEDPLHEEEDSPVPRLTHRYPDRVLLLITDRCPMYCRFCTRKRMVGQTSAITRKDHRDGNRLHPRPQGDPRCPAVRRRSADGERPQTRTHHLQPARHPPCGDHSHRDEIPLRPAEPHHRLPLQHAQEVSSDLSSTRISIIRAKSRRSRRKPASGSRTPASRSVARRFS